MKEKYFINARIIDPSQNLDEIGGIIVDTNGKIKEVGKNVKKGNIPTKAEKIDLKGKVLIPGIVDMKVFIGEPGFEYKENFRSLSSAALSGGVTSVVSMPNTSPVIDNVSMVDFILRRGRDKAGINIYPSATLTRNMDGKLMTEFGLLSKKGIVGFTDATKTVQNSEIMSRIMNYASDLDVLVMQHPEDQELSKGRCINEGEVSTRLGLQGIPHIAEKIIIERDLSLLEEYPCRYHISQLSSAKSVDVISKYKKNGLKFSVGVSINNLSLNENDIGDFKTFMKFSPPLRKEDDRKALIQGIKDGFIDVIVSDHKPEDEESKRLPFAQAAEGSIGIETLLSLALELYHNDSLPLKKIIETITCNPAKILKINKGTLKKGSDADLCIFDPDLPWVVDQISILSEGKNTPFINSEVVGRNIYTIMNGKILFEDSNRAEK